VAINEVYYKGGIGQDWVEIVNTGSDIIDISDWWLCARCPTPRPAWPV